MTMLGKHRLKPGFLGFQLLLGECTFENFHLAKYLT
jgi:hypothetical protein